MPEMEKYFGISTFFSFFPVLIPSSAEWWIPLPGTKRRRYDYPFIP
jgi:hypothetical protein